MRFKLCAVALALSVAVVAVVGSPPHPTAIVAMGPSPMIGGGQIPQLPIPRIPRIPAIPTLEYLLRTTPRVSPQLPLAEKTALVRKMDVTNTLTEFRIGDRPQQLVKDAACYVLAEVAEAESEIAYELWAEAIYDILPDSLYEVYTTDTIFQQGLDFAVSYIAARLSKLTAWNYIHDFAFNCKR